MTADDLISKLWQLCRKDACDASHVPAEAVQRLIEQSREILTEMGCSKCQADLVLYGVYTQAHWDWPEPTARIFETLLEIELADFFTYRGMTA
jgi:hypothetical protein